MLGGLARGGWGVLWDLSKEAIAEENTAYFDTVPPPVMVFPDINPDDTGGDESDTSYLYC